MNNPSYTIKLIVRLCCAILFIFFCFKHSQAQEDEETYSISLVKTAEIKETIHEVDNKKILAQTYTVKEGDRVWKILRKKGLLTKHYLPELLSVLKKLNKSLKNIDLIHPGEKIIIPLKIVPLAGPPASEVSPPVKVAFPAALKDINLEAYKVMPGDRLTKIVVARYGIPPDYMYNEYLDLVKQLNPSIKNLDAIYPGQVITLPIYSPQIVKGPIQTVGAPESKDDLVDGRTEHAGNPMAYDLSQIFKEIGEEWLQEGEHFIALKSGGQIKLIGRSFPILSLKNGLRVIVDLNNKLPDKMARLIESNWGNYRVVHLIKNDTLVTALDKILRVCDYWKIYQKNETCELHGDLPLKVTGKWIISPSSSASVKYPKTVIINLKDAPVESIPTIMKRYLTGLGAKIIDYPPGNGSGLDTMETVEIIESGPDPLSLTKIVLNLAGKPFSSQVELPVSQIQKNDYGLIIKADFLLKVKDRDAIIDLTGIAPEIISILKEEQLLVLPLAAEIDATSLVPRILEFLSVPFNAGPHTFRVATGGDSVSIMMDVPGFIFSDSLGETVFATPLSLPDEISIFLSQKGYKILTLSFP